MHQPELQKSNEPASIEIKLGKVIFFTNKLDWLKIKDYHQSLLFQQPSMAMEPSQYRLGCFIQKEIRYCSRDIYYMKVIKLKQKKRQNQAVQIKQVKIQSQVQLQHAQQKQQIIFRIRIAMHSNQLIVDLLNFIQKGITSLYDPVIVFDQKMINQPVQGENQIQLLPFACSITVRENFMQAKTQQYLKYKQILDKSPMTYKNTFPDINKNNRQDSNKEFINLLNFIFNQTDVNQGIQQINKIKQQRRFIMLGQNRNNNDTFYYKLDQSYSRKYNSSKGDKSKQNVDLIELLSFDFLKEGHKPGQLFDLDQQNCPQTKEPLGFEGKLKPYQSKALSWMLCREGQKNQCKLDSSHVPFWYNFGESLNLSHDLFVNTRLDFIVWKHKVIKECHGGILADEMGLGKTIMLIALILAHRPRNDAKTLIICPLSIIKQWQQQINKFAPFLTVHVVNQMSLNEQIFAKNDIVITTQGKIRSEALRFKQKQGYSYLLNSKWFRIVLDEAHIFKNSESSMAKNIFSLEAEYRWCLTGTPIQNCLNDMFSLIKFLRLYPWCFQQYWEAQIFPTNCKISQPIHIYRAKQLLKGIILRRKKQSVDFEGNRLLNLPKIEIKMLFTNMTKQARLGYNMYNYLATQTVNQFQKLQAKIAQLEQQDLIGVVKSLKKARQFQRQQIWSKIMKMRMVCCHQFLINYKAQFVTKQNFAREYLKFLHKTKQNKGQKQKKNRAEMFLQSSQTMQLINQQSKKHRQNWEDVIRSISLGQKYVCLMCGGERQQKLSPCLHVFCKSCIYNKVYEEWKNKIIQNSAKQQDLKASFKNKDKNKREQKIDAKKLMKQYQFGCPVCQQKVQLNRFFDMPRKNQFDRQLSEFKQNQKIRQLIKYLTSMRLADRALVFTSFVGMMFLLVLSLKKHGIQFRTIQGNDSLQSRHKKISQFNQNYTIRALIFTLKTGSVGLNLEVANKIFFMDPWWNPAVQQQAIGRIHRMGQKSQVEAFKFLTKNSIETRVFKKAFSKQQVSDMILDIDDIENDKRYSISNAEIKYLLEMDQDLIQQEQNNNQIGPVLKNENNEINMQKADKNYAEQHQIINPCISLQNQAENKIPQAMNRSQQNNYSVKQQQEQEKQIWKKFDYEKLQEGMNKMLQFFGLNSKFMEGTQQVSNSLAQQDSKLYSYLNAPEIKKEVQKGSKIQESGNQAKQQPQ